MRATRPPDGSRQVAAGSCLLARHLRATRGLLPTSVGKRLLYRGAQCHPELLPVTVGNCASKSRGSRGSSASAIASPASKERAASSPHSQAFPHHSGSSERLRSTCAPGSRGQVQVPLLPGVRNHRFPHRGGRGGRCGRGRRSIRRSRLSATPLFNLRLQAPSLGPTPAGYHRFRARSLVNTALDDAG